MTGIPPGFWVGAGIPAGPRVNTFVECDCCGAYHRTDFHGDCREDRERFTDLPAGAVLVDACRTCGEPYQDGGDGFDGECPACADASDQKKGETVTGDLVRYLVYGFYCHGCTGSDDQVTVDVVDAPTADAAVARISTCRDDTWTAECACALRDTLTCLCVAERRPAALVEEDLAQLKRDERGEEDEA